MSRKRKAKASQHHDFASEDFYALLGVKPTASKREILTSYLSGVEALNVADISAEEKGLVKRKMMGALEVLQDDVQRCGYDKLVSISKDDETALVPLVPEHAPSEASHLGLGEDVRVGGKVGPKRRVRVSYKIKLDILRMWSGYNLIEDTQRSSRTYPESVLMKMHAKVLTADGTLSKWAQQCQKQKWFTWSAPDLHSVFPSQALAKKYNFEMQCLGRKVDHVTRLVKKVLRVDAADTRLIARGEQGWMLWKTHLADLKPGDRIALQDGKDIVGSVCLSDSIKASELTVEQASQDEFDAIKMVEATMAWPQAFVFRVQGPLLYETPVVAASKRQCTQWSTLPEVQQASIIEAEAKLSASSAGDVKGFLVGVSAHAGGLVSPAQPPITIAESASPAVSPAAESPPSDPKATFAPPCGTPATNSIGLSTALVTSSEVSSGLLLQEPSAIGTAEVPDIQPVTTPTTAGLSDVGLLQSTMPNLLEQARAFDQEDSAVSHEVLERDVRLAKIPGSQASTILQGVRINDLVAPYKQWGRVACTAICGFLARQFLREVGGGDVSFGGFVGALSSEGGIYKAIISGTEVHNKYLVDRRGFDILTGR